MHITSPLSELLRILHRYIEFFWCEMVPDNNIVKYESNDKGKEAFMLEFLGSFLVLWTGVAI